MLVNRLDYGSMPTPIKTDQGYLKAPCFATRAGIFIYRNNDGSTRRELRPPEEVFDSESMRTLAGVPVTDDHPPAMLNASNTSNFAKGFTGDLVSKVDQYVEVPLTITSADLIAAIETKEKIETSCGYMADLDETPGEWNGQKYDAIQRKIRYNHLAIVPRGRAGSEVKIRMDSVAVQLSDNLLEGFCMMKLKIDEVDFELSEPVGNAVTAKFKKDAVSIAELNAQCDALKAELDKIKGENQGMQIELDACGTEKKQLMDQLESEKLDSEKIHTAAMARLSLIKVAEKAIPTMKLDSLSNQEIKVEVIKSRKPDFKTDGLSEHFIDGMFEGLNQNESRIDALNAMINDSKGKPNDNVDARAKSMESDKNAWKSK